MKPRNRVRNGGEELDMAREAIASARVDLRAGRFRSCVSRAYYGVFHVTRAALLTRGIETKTHEGLRKMFSLHLVKPGAFPVERGDTLRELAEYRALADYGVRTGATQRITGERARELFKGAERFVREGLDWVRSEWDTLLRATPSRPARRGK